MERPLIVALDYPNKIEAEQFLRRFKNNSLYVKVGMELFYREGIPFIHQLKDDGHRIFLDLKLHDIPATVYRTMKNLASLEIDMINVHSTGGTAMMASASEGLAAGSRPGSRKPICLAVTQLTSTSQATLTKELLIAHSMEDANAHFAKLAKESGLDGVVCSVGDVANIQTACGTDFLTVTPGIRRHEDLVHDQMRIATPQAARIAGSYAIVVGRPITAAENPKLAYQQILTEWSGKEFE